MESMTQQREQVNPATVPIFSAEFERFCADIRAEHDCPVYAVYRDGVRVTSAGKAFDYLSDAQNHAERLNKRFGFGFEVQAELSGEGC